MVRALFEAGADPHWRMERADGIAIATPILPEGLSDTLRHLALEALMARLPGARSPAVAWYYTPLALDFTRRLAADVTVYDNMDELTLLYGADSRIALLETELLARADVPTATAISEYVDVAHAFFEAREAKFVNGVLDAVAKAVRS